jgi:hypothetical protein
MKFTFFVFSLSFQKEAVGFERDCKSQSIARIPKDKSRTTHDVTLTMSRSETRPSFPTGMSRPVAFRPYLTIGLAFNMISLPTERAVS